MTEEKTADQPKRPGRPPKEESALRSNERTTRPSSEKKTRTKKGNADNQLFVNPAEIPDGFTVEWKRYQVYGKEDTPHLNGLFRDGWEPAQPKDFPSLTGKYHKGQYILGGNNQDVILMIRPIELTEEAHTEDKHHAQQQVRTKLQELGLSKANEAPRTDSAGRKLASVSRSYEKINIE